MSIHVYDGGLKVATTTTGARITVPWFTCNGTAQLDRDTAQRLGTDLLRWMDAQVGTTQEFDYPTANGADMKIRVTDGYAEMSLVTARGDYGWVFTQDAAVDLAQRLLAWAGSR